jgi:hypothetical protein
MQTDIPLKRLMALRGADLLPLLGLPAATLVRVESRELPASATRLDTVLRIRSPQEQEYLHLVEWQGYRDPTVLWRLAGYMAWFGQQEPATVVVGTVIYLAPDHDVGDTLVQQVDGQVVQTWSFGRIRLWEQDAAAALASANLGLVVLSPLMHNASAPLVQQAIEVVLQQAPQPEQGDLLSILGAFAVPLLNPQRFIDLVGREKLMSSEFFDYLMQEYTAEFKEREAVLEAALKEREAALEAALKEREAALKEREAALLAQLRRQETEFQQLLEDSLLVRFPDAPLSLVRDIRRVHHPDQLHRLIVAVQQVADLAEFEQLLHAAANHST